MSPEIRAKQFQETKEVITACTLSRTEQTSQLAKTLQQIHLYQSFHKEAPADQRQPCAQNLQELYNARKQQAAEVKLFTNTIGEQQEYQEKLTRFIAMYEQSGALAQCDRCGAGIRPAELNQCRPVTVFLATLLCPACAP